MNFKPRELYRLKTGQVVEIIEVNAFTVRYDINGFPAKVLKKSFEGMVERKWAPPKGNRKEKHRKWSDEFK